MTTVPFALFRGLVQGVAAAWTFGIRFGTMFGLFAAIGLIMAYAFRFSPSEEYQPAARPRFSREKLLATCVRGLIIGVAGDGSARSAPCWSCPDSGSSRFSTG